MMFFYNYNRCFKRNNYKKISDKQQKVLFISNIINFRNSLFDYCNSLELSDLIYEIENNDLVYIDRLLQIKNKIDNYYKNKQINDELSDDETDNESSDESSEVSSEESDNGSDNGSNNEIDNGSDNESNNEIYNETGDSKTSTVTITGDIKTDTVTVTGDESVGVNEIVDKEPDIIIEDETYII
jgi:hypothetical protein